MFINKPKLEVFQETHRKHTYVPNKLFRQKVRQFVFNVVFPDSTNRNGNPVAAEKQGKMSAVRRIFFRSF